MSEYRPTDLRSGAKSINEQVEQAMRYVKDDDPRQPDPELEVIAAVLEVIAAVLAAVEPLDYHARARVLNYCQARVNAIPPVPPFPTW